MATRPAKAVATKAAARKKQLTPAELALQIKSMVLEFIVDLRDNVFQGKEKVELTKVEFFFKKFDADGIAVAQHIVKLVLPHVEKIKERNLSFFVDNRNEIFKGVDQKHIDTFSGYLTKTPAQGGISAVHLLSIWAYFDTFVALAELFKKYE